MSRLANVRVAALTRAYWLVIACAACSSSDKPGSPPAQPVQIAGSTGASVAGGQGQSGQSGTGTTTAMAGRMGTSTPTGNTSGTSAVSAGNAAPTAGMNSQTRAGSSGTAGAAAGASAAGMTASAGGAGGMQVTMTEPCNPADKTADATPVEFATPGEGPGTAMPTGKFKSVMEGDPGIPTHTIIRPDPIGETKLPILAWGEGGCGKSGNSGIFTNLFKEFASHGILIVADGPPRAGGPTMAGSDAKPLLYALEWAIKENARPCSKYYQKLDVTKLAVSGQSCGGLMAIQAATDPRITTAFPYNSGLFARDQAVYDKLHAPMAIFDGGEEDIAYANGLADFNAITKIPILFANPTSCSSNAHVCTFFDASAGEFGRAGVAWMRWHLLGDQGATGKGMFIGDQCGLCGSKWKMQWKMAPM